MLLFHVDGVDDENDDVGGGGDDDGDDGAYAYDPSPQLYWTLQTLSSDLSC